MRCPLPPGSRNPAEQLGFSARQRHPELEMPAAARRAGRGSLVPACVFGRVSLTSCQINIYSQIYLFAFVAENSRGVVFFVVLLCFVPLVYFWLRGAGERGSSSSAGSSPSSCFLQPVLGSLFCTEGLGWQQPFGCPQLSPLSLRVPFGPCCWFEGRGGMCTAPVPPGGLQDPGVSAPAPPAGAALQPRGAPQHPARSQPCCCPRLLFPSP